MRYFKHANRAYLDWAVDMGFIGNADADRLPALLRAAAALPPRRARATAPCSRPSSIAQRIETLLRSAAVLVSRRSRTQRVDDGDYPLHAITQRPMAMYHSWGSQNAWLRQIHGAQPPVHEPRTRARSSASPTTTGCGSTSRIGRVKAQVKLMEGVNADTVWTWNAIGKRARRLGPRRRRAGGRRAASCSTT